jgi:TonB family protein
MSEPGDVDKMVSDFLAELNALDESLRRPDRDPRRRDTGAAAGEPEQVPEAAQHPGGTAQEAESPAPAAPKPVRNIDVLLMEDSVPPPAVEQKQDEDDLFQSCRELYESRFVRLARSGRRRNRGLVWGATGLGLVCLIAILYNQIRLQTASAPAPPAGAVAEQEPRTTAAQALDEIAPKYPSAARRRGTRGIIEVMADVDEEGTVLRTLPVSGPANFRSAAARAVAKCRFRPAQRNGVAIKSTVTVSVPYP